MTKPVTTLEYLQKLLSDSNIGWNTTYQSGEFPEEISGGLGISYTEYTTINSDSLNCFGSGYVAFFSNNGIIISLGIFND